MMPKSPVSAERGSQADASVRSHRETRYLAWLEAWRAAGRAFDAAELLTARFHGDLGWLEGGLTEPVAIALLEAYDAYPELAAEHPPRRLADSIAAAPSRGAEERLSHLAIARRLDLTPERTLAVLLAGRGLIERSIYDREVAQWLEQRPPRADVIRLTRGLAEDAGTSDTLDVAGRLAVHGTRQPSLSAGIVARFGARLTLASRDDDPDAPSGVAMVRARQAVDAATTPPTGRTGETATRHLATIHRLRSHLQKAGYDAARPPRSARGRTIAHPSWIGGWGEFVSRQGGGLLTADYFETEVAERDPRDGGLTANVAAPYQLATTPEMELPIGHFRVTFNGGGHAEAVVRCEGAGYTGRRDRHSFAVSTRTVSPTDPERILGVLEFVLEESATNVTFAVETLKAGGPVTLAGIDIRRLDD